MLSKCLVACVCRIWLFKLIFSVGIGAFVIDWVIYVSFSLHGGVNLSSKCCFLLGDWSPVWSQCHYMRTMVHYSCIVKLEGRHEDFFSLENNVTGGQSKVGNIHLRRHTLSFADLHNLVGFPTPVIAKKLSFIVTVAIIPHRKGKISNIDTRRCVSPPLLSTTLHIFEMISTQYLKSVP